ncbi:MAG: UvrB/UvrC motif-containing protein, partial [Thermoguttaceae bacterium]
EAHPDGPLFHLEHEDCARLWREAVQYYHRYLSFWHLDLFELCARDTLRNLRLFAFVCAHCNDERIKLQFDQWRPYVRMMHTRAVATPLLTHKAFAEGLRVIDDGIEAIHDFLDQYNQTEKADILSSEASAAAARPKSMLRLLRQKLDEAIGAEEFEDAARIRDEIRNLSHRSDESG